MAEKKTTTKAAAKTAETKAPAKKACAKKACATKATETKATTTKKAAKAVVYVNAENAGFRAGDVYQVLAAKNEALTIAEIAKAAKVTAEDVLLGLGWLLKEGKVAATEDNKIVLA